LVYLQENNHFKQQTPFPKTNMSPGIPVLVSVLTDDITTLNQQTLQYQIEGISPGEKNFLLRLCRMNKSAPRNLSGEGRAECTSCQFYRSEVVKKDYNYLYLLRFWIRECAFTLVFCVQVLQRKNLQCVVAWSSEIKKNFFKRKSWPCTKFLGFNICITTCCQMECLPKITLHVLMQIRTWAITRITKNSGRFKRKTEVLEQ
jgi:hypothetical protein